MNTPPKLTDVGEQVIETGGGSFAFTVFAQDEDTPAQTLTYTLMSGPSGAAINSATGDFTWTPPGTASTNYAVVRVTDNGTPALWDEETITLIVAPANAAPVLSLGTAVVTENVVDFQTFSGGTANGIVMFHQPSYSSTTSAFLGASPNESSVTNTAPAGNSSTRIMKVLCNFKTGTTNPWLRLTTFNAQNIPNPTINLSGRLRFDIWTDKAIKLGLILRESGTTAAIGGDGGTTGSVEYVGVTNVVSGSPFPNRQLTASNWTTVEFDLPNEQCRAFTGNGVLATGKGVLESLIIVPAAGMGNYAIYVDNFQVISTTTLPGTVNMSTSSTLTFTASASDPNPGAGLSFGLDPDTAETTTATIDSVTGAFSWTPTVAGSNTVTVSVNDDPTNGGIAKEDSETFTVVVATDTIAPQSTDGGMFVAGGDSVELTWESNSGAAYDIQAKAAAGGEWSTVQTVTASGSVSTLTVNNSGDDSYYRVVETTGGASAQ